MADGGRGYRNVLADVAGCLEDEDAIALAFELEIPKNRSCKIKNGLLLMREMERINFITKDNVDKLLSLLQDRNYDDAAGILEKYKTTLNTPMEWKAVPTSSSGPVSAAQGSNSDDRYKMTHSPRGHCLILTYDTFSDTRMNRDGNNKDRAKLNELFGRAVLNFQVHDESNLNLEDTKKVITVMAKENHYDCLVVFVCSHGDEESFLTSDGHKMKFQAILEPFKPHNCSGLSGKPKIFFFNTCLGEERQHYQEDSIVTDGAGLTENLSKLRAKEADFCICLSTVPGYVALRHKYYGTFYVQHLYKCFMEKYQTEHLSDILTFVRESINKEMEEAAKKSGKGKAKLCQLSPTINGLLKKVYF